MPEVSEIRGRLDLASKGPWFAVENDLIGGWCVRTTPDPPSVKPGDVADLLSQEDAEFISHAREDIELLLSKVEAGTEAGDLSYSEVKTALLNINWDAECGECMCIFYTGSSSGHEHDPGCTTKTQVGLAVSIHRKRIRVLSRKRKKAAAERDHLRKVISSVVEEVFRREAFHDGPDFGWEDSWSPDQMRAEHYESIVRTLRSKLQGFHKENPK